MNFIGFSGPRNCLNTQYAALSGAMHVFACIVLKSQYLKACQGRQLNIIEIIFLSEKKLKF